MNLYAYDPSLFDFTNFSDLPIISHHSSSPSSSLVEAPDDCNDRDHGNNSNYNDDNGKVSAEDRKSPPRHRHDGTSPLPLGMDWSAPPRKWDGRETVWPHDPHTGWSYCVTVPSWVLLPRSKGSDPVTFYRVQVGIQSPEGVTTTRGILRRFSDFLKLLSELKGVFPKKKLPPAPPKRILRSKSRVLLEERRCALEDWMEKLLSDIDISRSASVALFLELEAAARSSFDDANQTEAISFVSGPVPPFLSHFNSDVSLIAGRSVFTSEHDYDSPDGVSEVGTPRHGKDAADSVLEASTSEPNLTESLETAMRYSTFNKNYITENLGKFTRHKIYSGRDDSIIGRDKPTDIFLKKRSLSGDGTEHFPELEYCRMDGHIRRLSTETVGSDLSSVRASEISNLGVANLFGDASLDLPDAEGLRTLDSHISDIQFQRDLVVVLPSDERYKLKRVLNTVQRRLAAAKTDMEELIARLNQEVAVRQFLSTKVKDLEVELETTRENCKENMEQAVLIERERFTQTQWDLEELRKQCLEMELKLKFEQDEKARIESAKLLMTQENEILLQELDDAREQLRNLHKHHEELEVKSKADLKLLVKEVKSLRNSQSELKQELGRVMKEKLELERVLQKEKQRMEHANAANVKLLHECEILRNRLQECSVNFLVEEEDKLIVDTSSPSDAIDLLTTSDNRIGLLLAEAQLLAQDVENSVAALDESHNINGGSDREADNELRRMLTDIFVDNARLRKQVNSVIRCALSTYVKSDNEDEEEETPMRKTVLSKFLER